jgi:hypothetical protein
VIGQYKNTTKEEAHTANKMFAQWWGDVSAISVIFVQRFVSWTGRGFESPPLRKHKRCGQLG